MKALELKVFPIRHDEDRDIHYAEIDDLGTVNVEYWIACKRLTDAELAAEMHAANSDAWRAHSAKGTSLPLLEDRFGTLARFATLPHYDEVTR